MTIENAIVSAIETALEQKFTNYYPVFADKNEMAKMLGISPRQLARFMTGQKLVEERHYTRFTESGHPMFAVKAVIAELKPLLADIEDII